MKLAFAVVILACWSKLSIANDDYVAPKFVNVLDELKLYCPDDVLSINFSNAVITRIGQDFVNSNLITCLDLSNNQIEIIANGAFSKVPKLTKLFLSDNKFNSARDLFTFGSHETLEILFLNNVVTKINNNENITISGSYPNLKLLSVRDNGFTDIISSSKTPNFPKLIALDLSGNGIATTNFVNLLPESLKGLYLHDNSLDSLSSLKNGNNITMLTLDGNEFESLIHYSNNPTQKGLWLYSLQNLLYLSITGNKIHTVESIAFKAPNDLVYLNLSRNAISALDPKTFAELKSLLLLDLSNNQLQKIIEISAVTNITSLSLSYNKIRSVPANAFQNMSELYELWLNGNQIEEINSTGFSHLYNLQILDLSNNKLSFLPEGWANAFSSLRYLDLSKNEFTSLESLSLSSTLPLVEVYLTVNPLQYLNASSFENLPKNVTVNLTHRLHTD